MKTLATLLLFSILAIAQHDMSKHDMSQHDADVKQHGAEAMGFDQDKTTHHFRLLKSGGYVQVEANDPKDAATAKQIRDHLRLQSHKFAMGDFAAPEHTHGQVPPGVAEMKKLKHLIEYEYIPLKRGAMLKMTSRNPQAIAAIHDFLKFQIEDHHTGDPTTIRSGQ